LTIFSTLIALGSILGLVWVILESPEADQEITLNAGILVLFGALAGGRLAYVAAHWEYFQEHLVEIPQFWLGGFSWSGALICGILGIFIAGWIFRIPIGRLADRLLPLLASLSVAIWLGYLLIGYANGPEVAWGLPIKDEWGNWKPRLPVQLIGAILTVALFGGIELLRNRNDNLAPGLAASLGLAGTSIILLVTSLIRVDSAPLFNGIRLEIWTAIIFLGAAIISGVLAYFLDRQ
jgi:prolipoprotein diacylglyceryltransferase